MEKQRTIKKEVGLSGVGLHTAKKVSLKFKPGEVDSGINFIRIDLPGRPQIRACVDFLLPASVSHRRTSLEKDGAQVQTIEHLMAALAGLCIDNILIEIDNEEIPGLDGSSLKFLELLNGAGLKEQDKERRYFSVREPIFVEEDGSSIMALPSNEFKISYTLNYDHRLIQTEYLDLNINAEVFREEIGPARTFCLEEEARELQRQGIGTGASYDNTLVVGKNGVIDNVLRFEDEFVRHKILDLMGDLNLVGSPLKGRIIALRSGHSLNLKLAKKIVQQMQRYTSAGIGSGFHPKNVQELGVEEIKKILPHRDPFLFVDKIIALEEGKHATGVKYLSKDEYFFKGHFPARPVMPGVLIIESMAQVGGVMMLAPEENRGKLAFFMAADNVKFRKTVLPGDKLVLDVVAGKIKSKIGQVHAKAYVDDKIVCEADLMFALVES